MKNSVIIGVLFSFSVFSLFPMEEEVKMLSSKEVVFKFLVDHYFGHDELCLFAQTNMENKRCILNTALTRRKLLSKEMMTDRLSPVTWHEYNSMCCYAYEGCSSFNLTIVRHAIREGQFVKTRYKSFQNFKSPLPHNPGPLVDQNENVYFYGRGLMQSADSVVRYDLDGCVSKCFMKIGEHVMVSVELFLEYPVLLKAILNSTNVTRRHHSLEQLWLLEFSLEGVWLPDNYHERTIIPGTSAAFSYESIQKFPLAIRGAIEKRYKECCNQISIAR